MSSYAYVVERALEGDYDWKIVKVFSSESALRPWLETVTSAARNVYFRVHKSPLDSVAEDEPYTVICEATKKRKRDVLCAKADLACAERDEKPAKVVEALRAKVAKAKAAVKQVVAELEDEAFGGDGGIDDALLAMPAAEPYSLPTV